MSIYDPPTEITPIFNPSFWISSSTESLTKDQADGLYLSIFGGQIVSLTESFASGIETNTIEPYGTASEVLTFTTTGQTEFSGSINVPSGSEYLIDGVPVGGDALPDQTGNAGKFLTTDGTDPSWDDVPDEIPSQTGQSGKYLTTDGTSTSWGTVSVSPAGSNTEVQFNNSGAFGADSDFTYNSTSNTLAITNGAYNVVASTSLTSQTALQLHFDASPIVDNGFYEFTGITLSAFQPSIMTTEKKFGNASVNFAAINQGYPSVYNNKITITNTQFSIGTNDFTLECWLYNDFVTTNQGIWQQGGLLVVALSNGGNIRFNVWFGGTSYNFDFAIAWSSVLNIWQHFAVVRQSGLVKVYLEGVASANTFTNNYSLTQNDIEIGQVNFAGAWRGFLDELRLTNGLAVYTSNFTPPTSAFPDGGSSVVFNADATGVSVSGNVNLSAGSVYQIDGIDLIASQTGNSGKFLTTDGTSTSWDDVPDELPSQTGNSGKFLTTDGTSPSWDDVPDELPSQTGNATKYLRTDGTDTLWAEENPIVGTGVPAITTGLDQNTFISTDTNLFYFRRYPTYDIRSNPTFSGTVIPVGSTRTYTTIAAAITAANAGDILELDQETFTISIALSVTKSLEIRGTKATSIVSGNLSGNIFTINASPVYIHDITVTNTSTSSLGNCIENRSSDFYCDNCIFNTNEFGVTSTTGQFKVSNCEFLFTGTPDSHRYIYTTGGSGDLIIQDNTFQAVNLSGTAVTRFVVMTAGTYTDLTKIIITGNSESSGTILSQFFLQDSLVAGSNPIQFFFDNNSASLVNSGILIFYASNALNEYEFVAFNDNNFGGNDGGSGTTGIVKLDLPSAGTLGSTIFVQKDNTYTGGITHPNYLTAVTGSDLIAYNFTVLSFPDITLYDSVWNEILEVPPISNPTFYDSITLQSSTDPLDEFALTIDGNGDMTLSGTGELIVTTNGIDMNGEHLNMTGGEIQNLPLLHGQTNTNLVIEAKGTGHIVFETNTVDVVEIPDTGGINLLSGSYQVNGVDLVASQTGNSGKYLTTDGTSTSWATVGGGGGTPGGSDTQVQFNDGGSFGGDSGLTFDKTTDTLTIGNGLVVNSFTAGSGLVYILHGDVFPFVDSSVNALSFTNTNCTLESSIVKFGTGSIAIPFVAGSRLANTTNTISILTSDFTFEGFFYSTSAPTIAANNSYRILSGIGLFSNGFMFATGREAVGLGLCFIEFWINGTQTRVNLSTTYWADNLNTWIHFAFTRASGICRMFINGVQQGSDVTNNGSIPANAVYQIGNAPHITTETYNWVGYMDEIRVINGVAVYTSNFTPPTSAFPDVYGVTSTVLISGTNVGVKTDTPAYDLDVTGDANVSNTLFAGTLEVGNTTIDGTIRNNNNPAQLGYYNTGRYVEIDASATDNAYIDFHSLDAGNNDYDCRILSNSGTVGTVGKGNMTLYCSNLNTSAQTVQYNVLASGTPTRTFAVQHLVWSGTVNNGSSTNIGLTKAYRGRYLISASNTNGNWNYVEAFVFGYTSDTKTTHQALYINGGSSPNISIGEEFGGSGFIISITNLTGETVYYHILSWIGGFGS